MAIVKTLTQAISYINSLYEIDSTPPSSGEEDYEVWKDLLNVAINIWENEEGVLWKELFVKLEDAADGDKETDGTNSYTLPTDFKLPQSGYVWIGSGTNKQAYKVLKIEEIQVQENNSDRWCYFKLGGTPSLEFNPNLTMSTGETISYEYYKNADSVSDGTDEFEMSDPMFAVYYVVSELKREEGDNSPAIIASQKMEAMKARNEGASLYQEDSVINNTDIGFGV